MGCRIGVEGSKGMGEGILGVKKEDPRGKNKINVKKCMRKKVRPG